MAVFFKSLSDLRGFYEEDLYKPIECIFTFKFAGQLLFSWSE